MCVFIFIFSVKTKIITFLWVCCSSLYITDENNVAVFVEAGRLFSTLDLVPRGHYEVHGDPVMEARARPTAVPGPVRFCFHCPSAFVSSAPQAAGSAPQASMAGMAQAFQR